MPLTFSVYEVYHKGYINMENKAALHHAHARRYVCRPIDPGAGYTTYRLACMHHATCQSRHDNHMFCGGPCRAGTQLNCPREPYDFCSLSHLIILVSFLYQPVIPKICASDLCITHFALSLPSVFTIHTYPSFALPSLLPMSHPSSIILSSLSPSSFLSSCISSPDV